MICPRCGQELVERRVGTGRACCCGACRGAWIPFGSVEHVTPRLRELAPENGAGLPLAGDPTAHLKCPECGGALVTVRSGATSSGRLRTCLVCFGRWIDWTDMAGLSGGGFMRWLAGIFRPAPKPPVPPDSVPVEPAEGPHPEESARTEPPGTDEDGGR